MMRGQKFQNFKTFYLFIVFFQNVRNRESDLLKQNRGHRTSKIDESAQSYRSGHLDYNYCSFYYLAYAPSIDA